MTEKVVITGLGIVSPVGHDIETFWDAILTGKSGAAETTVFDASTFPSTFSCEVKDYDLSKYIQNTDIHSGCNRGTSFALGAAAQACRQAGIDIETDCPEDGIDRRKLGIYLGAGEGSVDNQAFFESIGRGWNDEDRSMDWEKWAGTTLKYMTAKKELEQESNMPASHIALLTGARGPSRSCLTACAASTQAVGEAMMLIRNGKADIMIAGGAHSMIHPLGITGFNRLTALSTRNDDVKTASRPFSGSRDGFVIGEGAAAVIIESLSSARRRGADILAELTGYGSTSDAFRVTDMHEEGRGGIAAVEAALKDANITYKDVDWINTHGTSTRENDSIETKVIKAVFRERAGQVPVSSIKSTMGHLIGATGAAELISCVLGIRENIVPPTMNYQDPEPELDLDYVPNRPRELPLSTVINESFGFGGQNNVVVVNRYQD